MIVCESRDGVIAMIVIRLIPNVHARYACFRSCVCEVFRQKLALGVEIVSSSLL